MDGTGCRNMLEGQPGEELTLEGGSTAVSGDGTRFTSLRARQWIHTGEPLPSGAWLKNCAYRFRHGHDGDGDLFAYSGDSRAGFGAAQAWRPIAAA
ncbi:MAG: hypothetical protein R2762_28165 [Bryobacteraceae bacterium]